MTSLTHNVVASSINVAPRQAQSDGASPVSGRSPLGNSFSSRLKDTRITSMGSPKEANVEATNSDRPAPQDPVLHLFPKKKKKHGTLNRCNSAPAKLNDISPLHSSTHSETSEEQSHHASDVAIDNVYKKAPFLALSTLIDATGIAIAAATRDPYSIYSAGCKAITDSFAGGGVFLDRKKTPRDQLTMAAETSLAIIPTSIVNLGMAHVTPNWQTDHVVAKVMVGSLIALAANQAISKIIAPIAAGMPIERFNFTPKNFTENNPDAVKKSIITALSVASIAGTVSVTGTGILGNKPLTPDVLSAGSGNALSAVTNIAKAVFDPSKKTQDSIKEVRDLATGIVISCVGDIVVGHLFKFLNHKPAIGWPLVLGGTLVASYGVRQGMNYLSREKNTQPPPITIEDVTDQEQASTSRRSNHGNESYRQDNRDSVAVPLLTQS